MTSPDDILILELEQARTQGDDARVLGLAGAILAQHGSDQRRALAWLEEAAERLIEASRGKDFDAAVSWAKTWTRYARSPHARQRLAELQEQLNTVQACEQALVLALDAGDLGTLDAALSALPAVDRRRDTAALVERCTALRADRQAEADALRRDLAQLVPDRLERALGLVVRLAAIDPTAIPEREDLARRLAAVDALHRRAESAFESGPIQPLAAAVAALRGSPDRRGDSEALLTLAETELERRQVRLLELRSAFTSEVENDIEAAADTLGELAALDPGAPESARLTEVTTARMRIKALHATIESGLADPDAPEVRLALRELQRMPLRRSDSAELVATARATSERQQRQRQAKTLGLRVASALIGGAALVATGLWLRDHLARGDIARADDPETQLTLVRAYNGGFHFFATKAMRSLETRLVEESDNRAFDAARRQSTVLRRIGELQAYLLRPGARRVEEAKAMIRDLQLELEDGAFASANHVVDPVARLGALVDYAARARDPGRAARARELIAALRRDLDTAAWDTVAGGNPATRAERAAAYLRDAANVLHRAEAEELVAAGRSEDERRAAEAADDRAWAEARGSLAGARAYLARPAGRHRGEAETAVAAFLRAENDAAWASAAAPGTPDERLARLRAYLAVDEQRPHAEAARGAIAAIEHDLDEAAWAIASAPGTADEVDARIAAYLAGPTTRAHRAKAEELRQDLMRSLDTAAWKAAMAAPPPTARIAALDAYLAGPTARGYISASKEEIARCLDRLATSDDATLAGIPRGILMRVSPLALARLPADTLATLPVAVQARMPQALAWASESGVDDHGRWATLTLKKTVVRLRWIFPGTIATPEGTVACARGFWLAERECSQAQWTAVMGGVFSDSNPSTRQGPELPVENLTWPQVRDFVSACNRQLPRHKPAMRVRIPTTAEWTWLAATAADGPAGLDRGTATPWDEARLTALAWTSETSAGQTRGCAAGAPDAWGLADLLGNVREWVGAIDERSGTAAGGSYAQPRAAATRTLALARDARFADLGLRLAISP